jgi:ABC-type microcin C transport system duplicated ATPase subunit YejF
LLEFSEPEMERIRGNDISMIFQEPMTSLNPLYTCGKQIAEAVALHQGLSKRDSWDRAVEMLRSVSIPEPERRAHAYPHQLSGRHAPARHDRHGAVVQSQGADRRRADHRRSTSPSRRRSST